MAEAFMGEIRAFAFNFPPVDWASCDGTMLNVSQNMALFSIIGNMFGGDAKTTFALPNLNGNKAANYLNFIPIGTGQGPGLSYRILGSTTGSATYTLSTMEIPYHKHTANEYESTTESEYEDAPVNGSYLSRTFFQFDYNKTVTPNIQLLSTIGYAGGNQPHENRQPYLTVNYCICTYGDYPPRP